MLRVDTFFDVSIEQALRHYNILPEEEIGPAARFIRKCIRLDPQNRPSAEQLVRDDWFSMVE